MLFKMLPGPKCLLQMRKGTRKQICNLSLKYDLDWVLGLTVAESENIVKGTKVISRGMVV